MLFYFLLSRKSINFEEIFKINDMDKTYLNNVDQNNANMLFVGLMEWRVLLLISRKTES